MGIFKRQIGVLDVVFAESDGMIIDFCLIEIDLLFLFIMLNYARKDRII